MDHEDRPLDRTPEEGGAREETEAEQLDSGAEAGSAKEGASDAEEAAAASDSGPVTDRPVVALGVEQQLDPRHVTVERIVARIVGATFATLSLAGLLVAAITASAGALAWVLGALGWLLFVAALVWFALKWPPLEHRFAFYRLERDRIEFKRGVWWRSVVTVPRSRVQHIDLTQGPLQRRHGVATLVIHTAGTEHAQVECSGFAHETAVAIRDRLLPEGSSDAV